MNLYKTKPTPKQIDSSYINISKVLKQKRRDNIVSKIDYRTDTKHYPLRCYYVPGTWLVDEVFIDGNCFLFYVEGNSRYLEVYCKTSQWQKYTKSVNKLEMYNNFDLNELLQSFCANNEEERRKNKHIREIKLIIWDNAPIYQSAEYFNLDDEGIQTKRINVSQTSHSPMSILDLVVRTIRDLKNNYEQKLESMNQKSKFKTLSGLIHSLANYYNISPYGTLEEMTGIKGMTPLNIHFNEIIERQIIKYCQSWNYLRIISPNYKLKIGDKVLVKSTNKKLGEKKRTPYINNNQEFTIIGKDENNLYELDDDNISVPRNRLVKIRDK